MGRQLVTIVPTLAVPLGYFRGQVQVRTYSNVPFISWPDGRPCLLANLYMLELLDRKLSTRGRGGTLGQYARNLSHLLRYCHNNTLDVLDLTDDRFTHFMNGLRAERNSKNAQLQARGANARITIGRNCLDFLSYIGGLLGDLQFVNAHGVIRAEKRPVEIRLSEPGRKITRYCWHHRSLDVPDPQKHRSPIDAESIQRIYKAIVRESSTNHLIRRRQCFVRMLEMLGPRVGEVALLRVASVRSAYRMERPLLKITTLKTQSQERTRELPVLRQDLAEIVRYIDVHRRAIIKERIGLSNDHGFVFVSETTGNPICADTLSNEIGLLRAAAGVERQACAHMFRNRFITKMLIWLIEQYDLQNPDQLRKALLSSETLKQEIIQWTGHSSTKALDPYIDLAFKEFTEFKKVMRGVNLKRAYESFDGQLDRLVDSLGRELTVEEFKSAVSELRVHRDGDISDADLD